MLPPHPVDRRFVASEGRRRPGRFCSAILACAACLILNPRTTHGQSYLTNGGEPSFSAPEPIELGFTDTANGQLHLEVPLGSYPQRESTQPLNMRIVYNSTLWFINTDSGGNRTWIPALGNSGGDYFGWKLVPNYHTAWAGIVTDSGCQSHGSWKDQAGTLRYFPLTTVPSCATSTNGYASDASGYKMYYSAPSGVTPSLTIYSPDGTLVCQANAVNGNGPCAQAEDNNGNQLKFSSTDTDTLGRVLPMAGVPSGGQVRIPNSTGGTSLYQFTGATISVKTAFGQSGVGEYTGTQTVLRSITLPDNTTYLFQYDCDSTLNAACSSPHGQSAYYGLLTNVTTPTGGTASYIWQTFADSYGNRARWLYFKNDAGGNASFFPAVISTCTSTTFGCQQKLTVSRGDFSSTVYTFTLNNGAWPVKIQTLDSSGNTLSTVNNTFNFGVNCPFFQCHGAAYVQLQTTQTTISIPNGGSISKQTQFIYDGTQTSNVTVLKEWRYYSGTSPVFPTTPDRATYTSYLTTGTNNINRPLKVTVCNNSGSDADCAGGGSKVSQTMYSYDSYSSCAAGLKSVAGIANHDDANFGATYTARGNPTQVQRWVSGSSNLSTRLC